MGLGVFEQENTGLETPLRGSVSFGPGRRGHRGFSSAVQNMRYSPVNLGVSPGARPVNESTRVFDTG